VIFQNSHFINSFSASGYAKLELLVFHTEDGISHTRLLTQNLGGFGACEELTASARQK
jgi:hypothetical protein